MERFSEQVQLNAVLKSDSVGTAEAVVSSIEALDIEGVVVKVIHSGLGDVSKSDLFMAKTGSGLVVGFNVGILQRIKSLASEYEVEVRLHDTIYRLLEDLKDIARDLVRQEEKEEITGRARVIALFPAARKGIILGCEVMDGTLAVGKKFRVISAAGMVYSGKIESLHIEDDVVKEAGAGKQVGLKIPGFKRFKKGDMVECFESQPRPHQRWSPRGGVFDLRG